MEMWAISTTILAVCFGVLYAMASTAADRLSDSLSRCRKEIAAFAKCRADLDKATKCLAKYSQSWRQILADVVPLKTDPKQTASDAVRRAALRIRELEEKVSHMQTEIGGAMLSRDQMREGLHAAEVASRKRIDDLNAELQTARIRILDLNNENEQFSALNQQAQFAASTSASDRDRLLEELGKIVARYSSPTPTVQMNAEEAVTKTAAFLAGREYRQSGRDWADRPTHPTTFEDDLWEAGWRSAEGPVTQGG